MKRALGYAVDALLATAWGLFVVLCLAGIMAFVIWGGLAVNGGVPPGPPATYPYSFAPTVTPARGGHK